MAEDLVLVIRVEEGPRAGETLTLHPSDNSLARIGRVIKGNNLALRDAGVSQSHFALEFLPASRRWAVSDLGSSNGTFLNEELIAPNLPFPISHGDRVKVGEATVISISISQPLQTLLKRRGRKKEEIVDTESSAARDIDEKAVEAQPQAKGRRRAAPKKVSFVADVADKPKGRRPLTRAAANKEMAGQEETLLIADDVQGKKLTRGRRHEATAAWGRGVMMTVSEEVEAVVSESEEAKVKPLKGNRLAKKSTSSRVTKEVVMAECANEESVPDSEDVNEKKVLARRMQVKKAAKDEILLQEGKKKACAAMENDGVEEEGGKEQNLIGKSRTDGDLMENEFVLDTIELDRQLTVSRVNSISVVSGFHDPEVKMPHLRGRKGAARGSTARDSTIAAAPAVPHDEVRVLAGRGLKLVSEQTTEKENKDNTVSVILNEDPAEGDDMDKMTLEQWFDRMEKFLPQAINDVANEVIAELRERMHIFDEYMSTDAAERCGKQIC